MTARVERKTWAQSIQVYLQPRPFLMLLLAFSAGLPFLLTGGTLGIWLREVGIDRSTIGYLSWVGFTYSAKPLWAPLADHVAIPGLERLLGRRRSWMLVTQVLLLLSVVGFAFSTPGPEHLGPMIVFALLVAFLSATQDIVIDAWRIEAGRDDAEQAVLAAAYQIGYRIALFAAGAGALYLADFVSWQTAYLTMAGLIGVGIAATLFAPRVGDRPAAAARTAMPSVRSDVWTMTARLGQRVLDAMIGPFLDFWRRHGWAQAAIILGLIATYTLTDRVMGVMAGPFYTDMGFTKSEIATVSKVYGVWIGLGGALLGGIVIAQIGMLNALVLGAFLGAASNVGFAWVSTQGHDLTALTVAITIENLSGGFAGTTIIAYLSSLTSVAYTATQYALFVSLSSFVGKFLGGFSGVMVDAGGYFAFFIMTALIGLPAVVFALHLWREAHPKGPVAAQAP